LYPKGQGKQDATANNKINERNRNLQKTCLVFIFGEQAEGNNGTVTSTTQTTTQATPSPTQSPDYAIEKEIVLKGEDMPGGAEGDVTVLSESWRAYYAPVWQVSPPPIKPTLIRYNMLADGASGGYFKVVQASGNNQALLHSVELVCNVVVVYQLLLRAIVSELLKTSSIDSCTTGSGQPMITGDTTGITRLQMPMDTQYP
jgi:hypothetical protein